MPIMIYCSHTIDDLDDMIDIEKEFETMWYDEDGYVMGKQTKYAQVCKDCLKSYLSDGWAA
jgi:hypothetical protein